MEEKEAFRRVNSGKSNGENTPFSSWKHKKVLCCGNRARPLIDKATTYTYLTSLWPAFICDFCSPVYYCPSCVLIYTQKLRGLPSLSYTHIFSMCMVLSGSCLSLRTVAIDSIIYLTFNPFSLNKIWNSMGHAFSYHQGVKHLGLPFRFLGLPFRVLDSSSTLFQLNTPTII